MRSFRPLYEDFIQADDVIQKRATRATTESIRRQMEEDVFEGYLAAMSRLGTYGGQPELLAFVRTFDQDVMVHLPPTTTREGTTMHVVNEHRDSDVNAKPALHICYGGDEDKNAHYDSSQKSGTDTHDRPLTSRPKPQPLPNIQTALQHNSLSPRAVRNMKSDPSRDMMHELVTRGSKDLRSALDSANDRRARSPSIASSHYSTSSKRSFEDDGDQPRSSKRTDRRKTSLRTRAAARHHSGSPKLTIPTTQSQPTSSGPPTPTSSASTESSSDQAESSQRVIPRRLTVPKISEIINLVTDDEDDDAIEKNKPRFRSTPNGPTLSASSVASFNRDLDSNSPTLIIDDSRTSIKT